MRKILSQFLQSANEKLEKIFVVIHVGGEPDSYSCHISDEHEGKYAQNGNCDVWYNNGTLNLSEPCPLGWDYDPEIGPTIVTDVRYKIIFCTFYPYHIPTEP